MHELNLPAHPFKIRKHADGAMEILDPVRNKYIILTPEEWVRQHFVQFMISEGGLPAGRIAIEYSIELNRMARRCDVVYFDQEGKPQLIVECKRPSVAITQETFDQIARYNLVLQVPYLAVTNGLEHYYCTLDHESKRYRFLRSFPDLK